MTLPKERQASNKIEKKQLIQDIRKMNSDLDVKLLEKYDIDDLRKIKMANTPQPNIGNTAGRPKMQQGGKMKKGYQSKGKVISDKDADIKLAWRYAKAELGSGGKEASEQDFLNALKRVKSSPEMVRKRLNELQAMGAVDKEAKGTYRFNPSSDYKKMKSSKLQPRGQLSEKDRFQYGGIADMSAAPMIQPKKKKTQSGFRSKYSKGGGVRTAKYKI